MLVKPRHQLRLPNHPTLRLKPLHQTLQLTTILRHLRLSFIRLLHQNRHQPLRLRDLLPQRLRFHFPPPTLRQPLKSHPPRSHCHPQIRQLLRPFTIARIQREPLLQNPPRLDMRHQRLFSLLPQRRHLLLLLRPRLISRPTVQKLLLQLLTLRRHPRRLFPHRLALHPLLFHLLRHPLGL